MKKIILYVLYLLLAPCFLSNAIAVAEKETISFPSIDGLRVTADTYIEHPDKKTPLLCFFIRHIGVAGNI